MAVTIQSSIRPACESMTSLQFRRENNCDLTRSVELIVEHFKNALVAFGRSMKVVETYHCGQRHQQAYGG